MTKILAFNTDARDALQRGVDALAVTAPDCPVPEGFLPGVPDGPGRLR